MVSFLSLPWNGKDPVSISNCRTTQNGTVSARAEDGAAGSPRRARCNRGSAVGSPDRRVVPPPCQEHSGGKAAAQRGGDKR